MTSFRAALVQMTASRSVERNIADAEALIRRAAADGAEFVQTPENTNIMEHDGEKLFAALVEEERDPTLARMREVAAELGIWLHIGSLAIKVADTKAANRAFVIDPGGNVAARYDKIHLFDVDLPGGETYRESNRIRPGREAVAYDLPWGRLGLAICYDLRFPQLFRAYGKGGCDLLSVPAAFTQKTGEAHWHILLRARAIENGAFLFAAAQGGMHENGRETYGHSLIVDPWGRILAEADGREPGVIAADIDMAEVAAVRGRVPSLRHDRPFDLVSLPEEPLRKTAG